MAKNSIRDYSATNSANTDIQSIDISEGCSPAGINNAIREVMADLKDVSTGAVALESPAFDSVTGNLNVNGTVTASGDIIRNDATTGTSKFALQYGGSDAAVFKRNNSTGVATIANGYAGAPVDAININLTGNVGIGTTSPDRRLQVKSDENDQLNCTIGLAPSTVDTVQGGLGVKSGGIIGLNAVVLMTFNIGGADGDGASEVARIDSSGNVLVGTTDNIGGTSGSTVQGIALSAGSYGGFIGASRSGAIVAALNRQTSDGEIIEFRKDGSSVGSISCSNSGTYIYFGSSAESVGLGFGGGFVFPTSGGSSGIDNSKDLGSPSYRWDDIYATNGTIQTSDANEKQQIAALTDVEITAAKAISALFKTYKWNSAVEAKGDAARTHAGVIAQDVQAAMTAAGLDAGDYAFFISSTWWETQTEVPAVEAVEAVDAVYEDVVIPAVEEELDEDGNVIVEAQPERTEQRLVSEAIEAVEAVAAYTRTDTYDTAEEAPEGATERTRLGIRYPELLAFVGAATEQRLANIETRLAALEAN